MSTALTTSLPVDVTGLTAAQRETLATILNDVKASIDKLARAARLWVELPEGARKKIIEQTNPSLRDFWGRLTSVGNGQLHPQLAAVGGRAAALLGKLPIEEQERYVVELIPVVAVKGRGYDQRLVDVAEMTEVQRKQVFKVSNDGTVAVRDIEAQKAWLSEKAARQLLIDAALAEKTKVERTGWTAEKGKIWVKPPKVEAGLSAKDLRQMLKDLQEE